MIESILFLSSRETMRLELGKFASLSREDDPNLFPEMPGWRLLKTNYCFFFFALQTLVASGINFLLQLWCVEKGGPFIVSLYVPIQMIVVAMLSILTLGDPLYMGMYVLSLFIKLTMQIGSKHQRVKYSVCVFVCERERETERARGHIWIWNHWLMLRENCLLAVVGGGSLVACKYWSWVGTLAFCTECGGGFSHWLDSIL